MDDNFGSTNVLSDSKGKLPTPGGLFSVVLDPSMTPAYSNTFTIFPDTVTSQLPFYTTRTDAPSGHPSVAAHPRAHFRAWGIPHPTTTPAGSSPQTAPCSRETSENTLLVLGALTQPSFFRGPSPLSTDFKLSGAKDSIKIIFIEVLLSAS